MEYYLFLPNLTMALILDRDRKKIDFSDIILEIEKKHGTVCRADRLMNTLLAFSFPLDNLPSLKGKRFLDLASGSANTIDNMANRKEKGRHRIFEPWHSRFMHELGAEVTAVDYFEQRGEEFESHALNLLEKGALAFLPSDSFDFIACISFVCFFGNNFNVQSKFLFKIVSFEKILGMKKELAFQIARLLSKTGLAVLSSGHDGAKRAFVGENGLLAPKRATGASIILPQ